MYVLKYYYVYSFYQTVLTLLVVIVIEWLLSIIHIDIYKEI